MILDNPKISVILSNFNGEKYINLSIESFLSQNYNNKELIIVDSKRVGYLGMVLGSCLVALSILFR